MKVLVIGSRIPYPLHDGGAIATYNLLKGLSDQGVDVSFASLNTNKHFASQAAITDNFSFLKSVKTFDIDTDISAFGALKNLFSSKSYNIERFYNKTFEQEICQLIGINHFDVIHFEGLFVAAYATAIKKITKTPLLLRQHNIEYNIWKTLAKDSTFPKKPYLKLLANRIEQFEKKIIHLFDSIVTITENDEKEIRDLGYQGLLTQIPAGIEVADKQNDVAINGNQIYHIGSMEWMPNQQAMDWFHVDIWPLIHSKNQSAEFYMAGKNMPGKYLEMHEQGFFVLGEVNDLNDFVKDKSILVVPLKSGSGIRIKTIEAMLAQKAVVTSSQGAMGLAIKHGEHCLIADTAEDFATAVLSLLDDPLLRDKLADNGRTFALENFSNTAVSARWKTFYLSLSKSII